MICSLGEQTELELEKRQGKIRICLANYLESQQQVSEEPEKSKKQANKNKFSGNRQEKNILKHTIVIESTFSHACEMPKLATFVTTQKLYSRIYYS